MQHQGVSSRGDRLGDTRASKKQEVAAVAVLLPRSCSGKTAARGGAGGLGWAMARININLSVFWMASTETWQSIVLEITTHFNALEEWREQVQHSALKKASDAWINWKHVLYKEFLTQGKDPIPSYPKITKEDWKKFRTTRSSEVFIKKSAMQSELWKKNAHLNRMGVAGYYGMKLIWEDDDKEAVAVGGNPTFSEIRGTRTRDYFWARAKRHGDGSYYFEN
ncbi:hypothetical protein D1007_01021 [Hordeum vulgare]|nr:hypothetical protein D1007_01021 [Hordeum vulgare]